MGNAADVVEYVVNELEERQLRPIKTALVKFVYLSDIEAVRQGLPKITTLNWIFYKYGPYSAELDQAIEHVVGRGVDELAQVSRAGRSYKTYSGYGHEETFKIPPQERGIIKTVLDRWGGEDLNAILDYVYFETEPMYEAEWGRPLDFTSVRRRTEAVSLADYLSEGADPDRVRELSRLKQEFWNKAKAREKEFVVPSPASRYDEVFAVGLRATDEDIKSPR